MGGFCAAGRPLTNSLKSFFMNLPRSIRLSLRLPTAFAFFAGGIFAQAQTPGPDFHDHLGLQLYSLKTQIAADAAAGLDLAKGYGITEAELAGTGTVSPAVFAGLMQARGLNAISDHFDYARLKRDLPGVIKDAHTLGLQFIILPGMPHPKTGLDEKSARAAAADFNRWGKALKAAGIRLGYHTHGFEFRPVGAEGGDTAFDVFVRATDPEFVCLEMDVYWVYHAGQDPVAWLNKYPTRWKLLHLKDMRRGAPRGGDKPESAPKTDMVAIGAGEIDWPAVLTTARSVGVEHYFIEDETANPLLSIPPSLTYLRGLKLSN